MTGVAMLLGRVFGAVAPSNRTAGVALSVLVAAGALGSVRADAARSAGSPPVNGALPSISGTARQGESVSTTTGSWGGSSPIGFTYHWQRCGPSGASCSPISGATAATYKLSGAEVGKTVRAAVTAQNADGTAQALSAPSAVVANLGNAPANSRRPNPSGTAKEDSSPPADWFR